MKKPPRRTRSASDGRAEKTPRRALSLKKGAGRPGGKSARAIKRAPLPLERKSEKDRSVLLYRVPAPATGEFYPGDLEKLVSLVRGKGLAGLWEREASIHLPLESSEFTALAQRIEEAGLARILSFKPLHLVAKEALDFLGGKIVPYIQAFHAKHPKDNGVPLEKLAGRFDVPKAVLHLELKTLVHDGRLKIDGGAYALAGFTKQLPPREEKMLEDLETVCFGGDFRAVSLADIRAQFNLTPRKLEEMLGRLIERRRLVQGKDGFYLHSRWLDDLVERLRARPRKIITIAEFKDMTKLSRKFAIPLLELLDEMGVTRRRGSEREIL